MPSDAEWQASWSKLRDKFEDWSLSNSGMRLCIRKIEGSLHDAKLLHQLCNLSDRQSDVFGNELEAVIVQDALGISSRDAVGLPNDLSMEWWIACPKLAELARYGASVSEVNEARVRAGAACDEFKTLADHAALILSQRPKGMPTRVPCSWPNKGKCDARLWISLLREFAEDFKHSTLIIVGTLPVFAMGVLEECGLDGLDTIDPDPGQASMIVMELLRTRDWFESLGAKSVDDTPPSPANPAGPAAGRDGNEKTTGDPLESLTPAVKKAWASWKLAEANHAETPQDRAAYDWLAEQDDELFVRELAGYQLPAFATWQRYLRKARNAVDENKNQPRGGRADGAGSIVRADEK